uniref:AP2 domain-containing protein n=1 Tax=Neospora caninum (strain Liverpool) TaxID=572307 RepID=A0A0F7UMU2_NEOCL|nr:TPA: AP2 domain-containing protein [Neospora caninum Liverpool]
MLPRRYRRSSLDDSGSTAADDQSKRLRHSLHPSVKKIVGAEDHEIEILPNSDQTPNGHSPFRSLPAPTRPLQGIEEAPVAAHRECGVEEYAPRPYVSRTTGSSSEAVTPEGMDASTSYRKCEGAPPSHNENDAQARRRTAVPPRANEAQGKDAKNEELIRLARLKPKVEGVCFDRFFRRWVAKRAGLKKVYFPVYKYGFDRAYELAVSTRRGLENDAAAGIRGVGPLRPRSPWEPGCPGSSGVSLEHADSAQQPSVTVPRTCTQAAVAQGKMKSGQLEDSDEGDSDGDHLSEGAQLQKTPVRCTWKAIRWTTTTGEGSSSSGGGFPDSSSPSGSRYGNRRKPVSLPYGDSTSRSRTSSDVAAQEVAKQGAETAFHHIESPSTSCPKHKEQGLSAPTMLSLASFAPSQIDVEAERTADAANERTRLQGGEDRPRATTSSSGEGSIYMGDSTTASTTGSEDNSTLRAATSSCLFSESGEGSASTARAFMDDEAMQQALATDSAEALAKLLSALPAGVHFDFSSKRWFAVYSPRESPEANQHDHVRPNERVRVFDPVQYGGSMLKAFHACRNFRGSVAVDASATDLGHQLARERQKPEECQDTFVSSGRRAHGLSTVKTESPSPTADLPRRQASNTPSGTSLGRVPPPQKSAGTLGSEPDGSGSPQVPSNGHATNAAENEANLPDAEFGSETHARSTAPAHPRRSQRQGGSPVNVHSIPYGGRQLQLSKFEDFAARRGSERSISRRKIEPSTTESGPPGQHGFRVDEKGKHISHASFSEPVTVRFQRESTESAGIAGCNQRKHQNDEQGEEGSIRLARQEERNEDGPWTTASADGEVSPPSYRVLRQQSRELAARCLLVIFGNLTDVCIPAMFAFFPQDRRRRVRAVRQHRDVLLSGKHTRVLLPAYFQVFWPLLETGTLPQHSTADYIRRLLNGMHNVAAMHKTLFPAYPLRGELDNREGPYAFLDDRSAEDDRDFFNMDFEEC